MQKYSVPLWDSEQVGSQIKITSTDRPADFWHKAKGRNIICTLCYRECEIEPGQAGWCGIRLNKAGTMALPAHGIISMATWLRRAYTFDVFHTYKPGSLSAFFGGTHCTAGCSFCVSGNVTWAPDKLPWGANGVNGVGKMAEWTYHRAMLHPLSAIALAQGWGCSQVPFGGNEPTLTYEWVYDVARLARESGLDVCLETNGYSPPAVIRALAPFVNAVTVGVKGSASERFYEKYVRSPGAVPHVLKAIQEWRRAGVHLTILDVIPAEQMQSDEEFEESATRLYGWLAENLGELALLYQSPMTKPATSAKPGLLLSKAADPEAYADRIRRAVDLAHQAGLKYAYRGSSTNPVIKCHNCDGILLAIKAPTPLQGWSHQAFVRAGRCKHCGVKVPIKT